MKATLEYNVPDEQEGLDAALNGVDYYCALWEIKELLYKLEDYPEEYPIPKIVNIIRDMIPNSIYED